MTSVDKLIRALHEEMERVGIDPNSDEASKVVEGTLGLIQESRRLIKNRTRLRAIDDSKNQVRAIDALSADEIQKLPRWLQESIEDAVILGTSGNVVQSADGRKYHLKNPLNHLTGGQWTFFLNSVINSRYPSSGSESYAHHIRKIHPSPKPPQLMKEIIEFFTKENGTVLDFFMGVGGSLIGASLCGRRALGIDLSKDYVQAYRAATNELGLSTQIAIIGDSAELLKDDELIQAHLNAKQVDLILIDPPYGNMMAKEKSGEVSKRKGDTSPTPFTDSPADLGNLDLDEFFRQFSRMTEDSLRHLKERGHLVVFMKDLQPTRDQPNLLHARVVEELVQLSGLRYLGLKIWADQGVNLYPYGYPYSFVSNQIHQYILIFQKDNRGYKTLGFN